MSPFFVALNALWIPFLLLCSLVFYTSYFCNSSATLPAPARNESMVLRRRPALGSPPSQPPSPGSPVAPARAVTLLVLAAQREPMAPLPWPDHSTPRRKPPSLRPPLRL